MKKCTWIMTVVCIVSLAILFFNGCPNTNSGTTTDSYYIKFKLDGVQMNFDKGLTDVEENPFGIQWTDDSTEIWANPNVVSNGHQTEYIYILTPLLDSGTESNTFSVEYKTEAGDTYRSTSYTVTITTYESEEGVIEGTFSATVESVVPNGPPKEITEGEFRVKRIADNTNLW